MGYRYCVDVSIRRVKVPSDIAQKFLDDFKTGILIDRFMSYITLFRHLAMVMEKSLGKKVYYYSRDTMDTPIYELKQVICGRDIKVKHGRLEGKIHMFFKPYENEYRCNQLGVIISAIIACCRISRCRECIDYALDHIDKELKNVVDYDTVIWFKIKKKSILEICVEVR